MDTITLQDFLQIRYGVSTMPLIGETALDQVNRDRERERKLQQLLHPGIVRRIDSGFARSNTVHPDTALALYAICSASPTQDVFETGTYWGFSTAYLAAALRDKYAGKVYSFDIYEKAGKYIPKNLAPYVELHRGRKSTEMMPAVLQRITPGLFFQDSRHDYQGVREELEVVAPYLVQESVILFHDFVDDAVRRAAADVLTDHKLYVVESADPQQLGIAVKR